MVQSKLRLPAPVEHIQPGALPAAETALYRIRPKARAYKHNRTTSSANVILRPFTYATICKRRFPRRSPAMRGSALNSGVVSLVLMTELRYSPYCIRSRKGMLVSYLLYLRSLSLACGVEIVVCATQRGFDLVSDSLYHTRLTLHSIHVRELFLFS